MRRETVWKGRLGRLGHSVVIRFVLNVGCESAIKNRKSFRLEGEESSHQRCEPLSEQSKRNWQCGKEG